MQLIKNYIISNSLFNILVIQLRLTLMFTITLEVLYALIL